MKKLNRSYILLAFLGLLVLVLPGCSSGGSSSSSGSAYYGGYGPGYYDPWYRHGYYGGGGTVIVRPPPNRPDRPVHLPSRPTTPRPSPMPMTRR